VAAAVRQSPADRYQEAHEELELYFAAAPGILGLRGAQSVGDSSELVWDDRRSRVEHARRCDGAHDPEHLALARIIPTVWQMHRESVEQWAVALCVLTPRRWPAVLARLMSRRARGGNLTGLLLSSVLLRSRAAAEEEPPADTPLALLEFSATKASALVDSPSRRDTFFDPLIAECEKRFAAALACYELLRQARIIVEREESASEVAKMRRALV
jgi:hypothetical protein